MSKTKFKNGDKVEILAGNLADKGWSSAVGTTEGKTGKVVLIDTKGATVQLDGSGYTLFYEFGGFKIVEQEKMYSREEVEQILWDLSSCFGWDDKDAEEQIEYFNDKVREIKENLKD